jgi:hypothetical protein
MEYHGMRLSSRTRRTEPSWPTVIATTLRLWFERHPVFGRKGTVRRRVTLALAAVVVVALGAGLTVAATGTTATSPAVSAPRGAQPGPGTAGALGASAAVRDETAHWIAQQIASSAVVACDPAMCAALQADKLPATRLLVLGTAAADPLGSDVVVATAAVRNQFGARLASVYAPSVIASFGSGTGRIDVRAIAPDGAAAYQSALAADRRSRISAGTQLLRNPRISAAAAARTALRAGDVDPRLLLLLAALAVQQPVRIGAFGDPSPGSSPAVPLRSVQLAPQVSAAGGTAQVKASVRSMLAFIDAQQQPYLPLLVSVSGTSVLAVEYAAPSPLGLLGAP